MVVFFSSKKHKDSCVGMAFNVGDGFIYAASCLLPGRKIRNAFRNKTCFVLSLHTQLENQDLHMSELFLSAPSCHLNSEKLTLRSLHSVPTEAVTLLLICVLRVLIPFQGLEARK